PLLVFALVASAMLFGLQEQVLAASNREADRLNRAIRGLPSHSFSMLDRRWVVGQNGDIYHYDFFDPRANRFVQLTTYRIAPARWRLLSMTRAASVALVERAGWGGRPTVGWEATNGWTRDFSQSPKGRDIVTYSPFTERSVTLEPPAYFKSDEPE